MSGENSEFQSILWNELGVLMIPLPPHHPELNPIEPAFSDLVQYLKSIPARYRAISSEDFRETVENLLSSHTFSNKDMKKKYGFCGCNV